ncbi:MAG TPA: BMP family protein [Gemmatimonadaceae bacterium]|nr:BMP family protein [Gemmatimonadaceae bacterium]
MKVLYTVLNSLLVLALAACAGSDSARSDPDDFRVALLTPGPISDQSWNAGAYAGLQHIRDSLGAEISHVQTRTPAEFEESFRHYGAEHFDLVFGHGFEFQDAAVRVAPSYPATQYVTTSGNTVRANVSGMMFGFDEPSYVAGVLAASMSTSGTIGAIGGTELPPVRKSFDAFTEGARSLDPEIRVLRSYIGNWDDVSAGKEQALAQIARGADVIFQNADAAGLGVFQAAKDSRGVFIIGSNSDQNAIAPQVTLGSVVIDVPGALMYVAREVQAGNFHARVINLGSREGIVKLVLNPAILDRIPAATRATIDSVTRRLDDETRATHAGAPPTP